MSANKYFWATAFASLITILGLVILAAKNFQPVYQTVLEFCGKAAASCQEIIQSANLVSVLAVLSLVWLMVVFSTYSLKTWLTVRKVLAKRHSLPNYLEVLALKLGLANKIKLVDGNVIFCAGLINPEIVIGREIVSRMSNRELEAILRHESYHLQNLDPLKVLLVTSLSKTLFFLPMIGELSRAYLKGKELAADRYAEKETGKTYLAKALYKVLNWSNPNSALVPDLVPNFAAEWERVLALRGEKVSPNFSSWAWVASIFILTFLSISTFKPAAALAGGC